MLKEKKVEILERMILKLIYENYGVCIASSWFRIKLNVWPLEK
jgi:hypothetical protein